MATLDEGVVNLQRFVASLALATEALGKIDGSVQELEKGFTTLAGEVQAEGGGLNDHLGEMATALEQGEDEAGQALTDLTHAASEGEQTVGAARDTVEHTASDLEEKVQTLETELDEAHTALVAEGFEALGHTLDQVEQDLQHETQEEVQALEGLASAVHTLEADVQASFTAVESAIDEAAHDLADARSGVEAEADQGVHDLEAAGGEMESSCSSLEGELEVIYAALTSGADGQGHDWEQAVQHVGQEAAAFVEAGQEQRVDRPAQALEDDGVVPLTTEYAAVGVLLDAAAPAAAELEPLSEELVKSQTVVAQVDELMNALSG